MNMNNIHIGYELPCRAATTLAIPDGIPIDDVNIKSGLDCFTGNEEVYMKVLRSYTENTSPLLGIIKKYLECGNLTNYALAIRGIKGYSFGIGAIRAGSDAEQLEHLVKTGNTENIAAENGVFLKYMENLLNTIDRALTN